VLSSTCVSYFPFMLPVPPIPFLWFYDVNNVRYTLGISLPCKLPTLTSFLSPPHLLQALPKTTVNITWLIAGAQEAHGAPMWSGIWVPHKPPFIKTDCNLHWTEYLKRYVCKTTSLELCRIWVVFWKFLFKSQMDAALLMAAFPLRLYGFLPVSLNALQLKWFKSIVI
jgi:hypothetical protein